MKIFNIDEELKQKVKPGIIISGFTVFLIYILFNIGNIFQMISQFVGLFEYLLFGIVIAYVLNQPMKIIEERIVKKFQPESFIYRKKRGLSIFITLILFVCLMITLASIIIPNIIESLITLISNISNIISSIFNNIDKIFMYFNIDFRTNDVTSINELINMPWQNIVKGLLDFLTKNADGIMANATNFLSTFGVVFTSFIFSLYLLGNKEKFLRQFRKLIAAIFGYKITRVIFHYAHKTNIVFSSFITGQLVEAAILWILYYSTMLLFGFPYPELIATVISIFSFVPFFGPIAAMFVGAFLILSENVFQAFWFMVYFQILSQIEDNFIYPRVVGGTVGLPGIWVLLSIFIFGDLFGIFGTIIAVPSAACIYSLISELVNLVLRKRKLKITELNRISAEEFKAVEKLPLVVVLDHVRSLYNVGSVFRSSDAFRVEKICLCGITATPPNKEIHKTALGAELSVKWHYKPDTKEAVNELIRAGYTPVCIEQVEGAVPLNDFQIDRTKSYALILGTSCFSQGSVVSDMDIQSSQMSRQTVRGICRRLNGTKQSAPSC